MTEQTHDKPPTFAIPATEAKPGVVVSGMRPTGVLHIGHLFGVLETWVELQARHRCHYFVADWHALTTAYENAKVLSGMTVEVVRDWLAAGMDPDRSVIFVQSHNPAHAELFVLLSMLTPVPWLQRVPSYKEMRENLADRDLNTAGFLAYPLLQTADIILYGADYVPVGEDQLAHIEFSREVVRRFHHLYGEGTFVEPHALISKSIRLPGTDGRKMSKSYDNMIELRASEEDTTRRVRGMLTDPQRMRRTDPGRPELCPVYDYHKIVSTVPEQQELATGCRTAAIGCMDCKLKMAANLNARLAPLRERRTKIQDSTVNEILAEGDRKARMMADETLQRAREAMCIA